MNGLRCVSHLVMGMCRNRVVVYQVFHIFLLIFLLDLYLGIVPQNLADEGGEIKVFDDFHAVEHVGADERRVGEEVVFFEVSDFVHFVCFVVLVGLVGGEEDCFEFSACEEDC